MKKVCIVMGSDSDLKVMEGCMNKLDTFGVPYDVRIVSAHRTPAAAEQLSRNAVADGYGVIIAAAGKAAHLGGVLAAQTTLPVIGVPIKSSFMDGLDSLLSIVQMPSGIPVATVGVNGADNAFALNGRCGNQGQQTGYKPGYAILAVLIFHTNIQHCML